MVSWFQVLVTANDFTEPVFKENLCATVEDLLSMNVVPVFNENDAISKGAALSKVRSIDLSPIHSTFLLFCTCFFLNQGRQRS